MVHYIPLLHALHLKENNINFLLKKNFCTHYYFKIKYNIKVKAMICLLFKYFLFISQKDE